MITPAISQKISIIIRILNIFISLFLNFEKTSLADKFVLINSKPQDEGIIIENSIKFRYFSRKNAELNKFSFIQKILREGSTFPFLRPSLTGGLFHLPCADR